MTDPEAGCRPTALSSDGTTSVQTSTTNIGAYMWSTLVADRLGFIDHAEAVDRLAATLGSLETMERHEPSGQYYNWYDHHTGAKLTAWPPTGEPLTPILSSVDNGWLATALHVVATSVPEVADARRGAVRSGWTSASTTGPRSTGSPSTSRPTTGDSPCCYDTIVSESRIAQLHRHRQGRAPRRRSTSAPGGPSPTPATGAGRRRKPLGVTRTYLGVDVFEGAYPYDGMLVVPGLGRQHVRGADARAVRARGAAGAPTAGRSTTR